MSQASPTPVLKWHKFYTIWQHLWATSNKKFTVCLSSLVKWHSFGKIKKKRSDFYTKLISKHELLSSMKQSPEKQPKFFHHTSLETKTYFPYFSKAMKLICCQQVDKIC